MEWTVLAGMIGNAVEWYDYGLYGYLAPVLATLFFPSTDPLTSLMATFGVFAAGFLLRPLGQSLR
jgi:MHS family proline/betaine transporter-like MFS transporter